MSATIDKPKLYVCAYRIRFSDGGDDEYGQLAIGTKDVCEKMADLIPAIAYSGPRPVAGCDIGIFESP